MGWFKRGKPVKTELYREHGRVGFVLTQREGDEETVVAESMPLYRTVRFARSMADEQAKELAAEAKQKQKQKQISLP